ncbi:MAG TPA: DUF6152 family protein [Candidatus Acidoferrales bacterium]|nr:DUF6152 family protein [Candidatus Acidoferrales bacterium]
MRRNFPVTRAVNLSLLVVSALLLAIPLFAHHGFQFEFDGSKYIYITGTLTKVEWENPHIYFNVESKTSPDNPTAAAADGKITNWRFEGSSVSLVQRTGTRRADLVDYIGKTVTVRACPGKGDLAKGAAETVKLPDDREVVVGRKRYYGTGPVPADIDKDPVN